MIIREANQLDNEALCKLCEHSMPGTIQLSLERRPDYFVGAKVQNEQLAIYVCVNTKNNLIEGVFSIGSRRVWLEGKIESIRYFSDLRLLEHSNKAKTLFHICNFIHTNQFLVNTCAQTIVFEGNLAMHKIIDLLQKRASKHQGFQYFKQGTYLSWMLNLKNKPAPLTSKITVRRVQFEDLSRVNEYLLRESSKHNFFPFYQLDSIENEYNHHLHFSNFFIAVQDADILGICAVWDQIEFKQTKVISYARMLHFFQPLYNLIARNIGAFELPEVGKPIPYLNLHCVSIKEQNINVFKALVNEILHTFQGKSYAYLLCGLSENDPLQSAFHAYGSKRSIRGDHYLVAYQRPNFLTTNDYYLELSRI